MPAATPKPSKPVSALPKMKMTAPPAKVRNSVKGRPSEQKPRAGAATARAVEMKRPKSAKRPPRAK